MAAAKVARNAIATAMEASLNCMLRDEISGLVNGLTECLGTFYTSDFFLPRRRSTFKVWITVVMHMDAKLELIYLRSTILYILWSGLCLCSWQLSALHFLRPSIPREVLVDRDIQVERCCHASPFK